MTKFIVRHYSGSPIAPWEAGMIAGLFLAYPDNWPIVCGVWADSPEHAFELTNHIDSDWQTGPEIRNLRLPANHRSTSVGDIIIEYEPRQAPKIYVVMPAGMQLAPGNIDL